MTDQPSVSADPLVKEAESRLKQARKDKDRHRPRLDDYYKLAMPWRHTTGNEYTPSDIDEVFDNTAMDCTADFAAEMLATFTPSHFHWVEPVPAAALSLADQEIVSQQIAEYTNIVFSEIRRSNFYAEAHECYADLTHGTMGIMIADVKSSEPIHCEAIPAPDLLIGRGPYKTLDIKGFEMMVAASHIPVMWPDAKKNTKLMEKIQKDSGALLKVTQVVWRDHADEGNEAHHYVCYTGDHLITSDRYTGDGSCPMIAARWYTDSTTPWGIGPGLLQLPNTKTANLLTELILKNADFAVEGVYAYDDDGIINFDNGISPGDFIPRMPGSKIDALESGTKFDVGYFTKDELRQEIKRGYYQDQPEQRGKTPPTAEQWLDEAARAARRMGAPAGRLVPEWLFPVFKRFAYLLNKRGVLPKVELNGNVVALNPTSPLIKQQKMEEALQLQRYVGVMASVVGQEIASQIINVPEAAQFLKERMGIKANVLMSKEQIQAAVDALRTAFVANAKGTANVME